MIELKNVSCDLGGRRVLDGIDLVFNSGEIVGLAGGSGSGKSALMKLIAGKLSRSGGEVRIDDMPPGSRGKKEFHRVVYYLDEKPENLDETVGDFLLLSRIPYKRFLNPFTDYDLQTVEQAMALFELEPHREEPLAVLSEDQFDRVLLAFAFARGARVMLLDNPTRGLDIRSTVLLQKAISRYVLNGDTIVVIASSDLNFIAQTADRVIVLDEGRVALAGTHEIIDADLIKQYFGVDVFVSRNVYNGRPNVHFFPES